MRFIPQTLNRQSQKTVWVVDNFYADPYAVRDYALRQEFKPEIEYFKGSRSIEQFFVPGRKNCSTLRLPLKYSFCGLNSCCKANSLTAYGSE